jgi:hypothetical protein
MATVSSRFAASQQLAGLAGKFYGPAQPTPEDNAMPEIADRPEYRSELFKEIDGAKV